MAQKKKAVHKPAVAGIKKKEERKESVVGSLAVLAVTIGAMDAKIKALHSEQIELLTKRVLLRMKVLELQAELDKLKGNKADVAGLKRGWDTFMSEVALN